MSPLESQPMKGKITIARWKISAQSFGKFMGENVKDAQRLEESTGGALPMRVTGHFSCLPAEMRMTFLTFSHAQTVFPLVSRISLSPEYSLIIRKKSKAKAFSIF